MMFLTLVCDEPDCARSIQSASFEAERERLTVSFSL